MDSNQKEYNKREWKSYQVIFIRLAASILLLLGSRWLYLFLFTDYREHHAPVMIPLGIVTILYSISLLLLFRISIIISLILSIISFVFALYIQFSTFEFIFFLFLVCIVSLIYVVILLPTLLRKHSSSQATSCPP